MPLTPGMKNMLEKLADGEWHKYERGEIIVAHSLLRRGFIESASSGGIHRAKLNHQGRDALNKISES